MAIADRPDVRQNDEPAPDGVQFPAPRSNPYSEDMAARRFLRVMSMYGPEGPAEIPAPEPPFPDVAPG